MGLPTTQQVAPPAPPPVQPSLSLDEQWAKERYNTQLTPQEEAKYQEWAANNNRLNDDIDYDMRGAWKEMQKGGLKQSDNGHFPDTFKKPNHPTFSDQSKYHGSDGKKGGRWGTKNGKDTYTPSKSMIKDAESMQRLRDYFDRVEPNALLLTPE